MIHLSACTVPLIERMAAAAATFHTQLGHVANTAEQKGAAPGTQAVAAPAAASLLPIARSRRETDATKNAADCEPSLPRRHQRPSHFSSGLVSSHQSVRSQDRTQHVPNYHESLLSLEQCCPS